MVCVLRPERANLLHGGFLYTMAGLNCRVYGVASLTKKCVKH